MIDIYSKCYKVVGGNIACTNCACLCIKYGRNKTGKQRYHCRQCSKTFLESYDSIAYSGHADQWIIKLLKESCGIKSISRLLSISVTTVLKRIKRFAKTVRKPFVFLDKEYELDEMRTYVGKKKEKYWIVYAIRKDTKQVVDFAVGRRTNETLKLVTDTLILSNASKVHTDKLPHYKSLLPGEIHITKHRSTNHIERKNLTLRTHLKRLNRKTICFSKSAAMLSACLKIYFWG